MATFTKFIYNRKTRKYEPTLLDIQPEEPVTDNYVYDTINSDAKKPPTKKASASKKDSLDEGELTLDDLIGA